MSRDTVGDLPSEIQWPRACLFLGSGLLILLAVYWRTLVSIFDNWARDPFGHGYIVVPAVLYFVWQRRRALASLNPTPSLGPLLALGLLAFIWLLAQLSTTSIVQQFCLVAMVVAFVWSVLGTEVMKVLMFPLGLLVFTLPLGDRLVPTLQGLAARIAVELLRLAGLPALLEGHVISIPNSKWQVAEACSGINYLVSSLAVGYLFAGLRYRRWVHRVGFVVAAGVAPLVANGLRVFTTILIASLGATGLAAGLEHNLYGVAVFGITTFVLLATCGGWREEPDHPSSAGEPTATSRRGSAATGGRLLVVTGLGLLIVGSAPLSARLLSQERVPLGSRDSFQPTVSGSWKLLGTSPHGWQPQAVAPNAQTLLSYESGPDAVTLYVAYYRATQPAVKLATAANALYDRPWWPSAEGRVAVTVGGHSFRARETILRSPGSVLRMWSWYIVSGTPTGDDYVAKLLLAKARLFRSPQGAALVAIAADEERSADASVVLHDFAEHLSFDSARDFSANRFSTR